MRAIYERGFVACLIIKSVLFLSWADGLKAPRWRADNLAMPPPPVPSQPGGPPRPGEGLPSPVSQPTSPLAGSLQQGARMRGPATQELFARPVMQGTRLPLDPYAHAPNTPRPQPGDPYAQPPNTPRPMTSDPYAQPPNTPRPGGEPYMPGVRPDLRGHPGGMPRMPGEHYAPRPPTSDPYTMPPGTPHPYTQGAPIPRSQSEAFPRGPYPRPPDDPYATQPATPRPGMPQTFMRPRQPFHPEMSGMRPPVSSPDMFPPQRPPMTDPYGAPPSSSLPLDSLEAELRQDLGPKYLAEQRQMAAAAGALADQLVSTNKATWYMDGLTQDCGNSTALVVELLQSCAKTSTAHVVHVLF